MVLNRLNVYRIKLVTSRKVVSGSILVAGLGGMLLFTNPSLEEYRTSVADQLVDISTKELCFNPDIPLIVRLLVDDCPMLVSKQRSLFEELAGQFTKRINLGICSIYITKFGGQKILPNLQLPSYKTITFAAYGRFMILKVHMDQGSLK